MESARVTALLAAVFVATVSAPAEARPKKDRLEIAAERLRRSADSTVRQLELARAFYGPEWRLAAFAVVQETLAARLGTDAQPSPEPSLDPGLEAYLAFERLSALSELGLFDEMPRELGALSPAARDLVLRGGGTLDLRLEKKPLRLEREDLRLDLAAAHALAGRLEEASRIARDALEPPPEPSPREEDRQVEESGQRQRRERLALRRALLQRVLAPGETTDPFPLLRDAILQTAGNYRDSPFDSILWARLAIELARREGYDAIARYLLYASWSELHFTTPLVDALVARERAHEPFTAIARRHERVRERRDHLVGEIEAAIERLRFAWAALPPGYAVGPRQVRPGELVACATPGIAFEPTEASTAAKAAFAAAVAHEDPFRISSSGDAAEILVSGPTLPWPALSIDRPLALVPEPRAGSAFAGQGTCSVSWVVKLLVLDRAEERALLLWEQPFHLVHGWIELEREGESWRVDNTWLGGAGVMD